jgi:hypothetical protein
MNYDAGDKINSKFLSGQFLLAVKPASPFDKSGRDKHNLILQSGHMISY